MPFPQSGYGPRPNQSQPFGARPGQMLPPGAMQPSSPMTGMQRRQRNSMLGALNLEDFGPSKWPRVRHRGPNQGNQPPKWPWEDQGNYPNPWGGGRPPWGGGPQPGRPPWGYGPPQYFKQGRGGVRKPMPGSAIPPEWMYGNVPYGPGVGGPQPTHRPYQPSWPPKSGSQGQYPNMPDQTWLR